MNKEFSSEEHWNRKEYWTDENGTEQELSSSMTLMPDCTEVISCPICRACLNQKFNEKELCIYCQKLGDIPEDIGMGKIFQCDSFEENRESYDYPLVKKLMKENNKTEKQ